ncbi:MBL fold metallo-hydrolase [Candidatus Uhrbacteria bacterium]|nr:MBL fold metallo-hydrolase [Candidatus Uhrbacteria bacterium]
MTMQVHLLVPGAMYLDGGSPASRALVGIPPCVKQFLRQGMTPPTTFVLPDTYVRRGIPQVALEFFFYHFLFVQGKAFGKLAADARLVVVGTSAQLARARTLLTHALAGPSIEEMAAWTDASGRPAMTPGAIAMLRSYRAWFAPKRAMVHGDGDAMHRCACNESAMYALDDVVEWRTYDAEQRALLAEGVMITRHGDDQFTVCQDDALWPIDLRDATDQLAALIALPPQAEPRTAEMFGVHCLGADAGFEPEHPTTGFAIALHGAWALVDTPIGAPELLARHGMDPAEVHVIMETHGHEDHMGSALAFLLEGWTAKTAIAYVASEPVYRVCVARLAALLDLTEAAAADLLAREFRGGVHRVRPGVTYEFCGARWQFAWTVHPVPTLGFRVTLLHRGRTYALAYSSDTAGRHGPLGTDAMAAAGFFDPRDDPFPSLVRGDEALVLWEAGGTHGDPIHVDVREWELLCTAHGIDAPVAFMHTRSLPPEYHAYVLARPGWHVTLIPLPPRAPAHRLAA